MAANKIEETTAFIREYRSNEANFEKLLAKLEEEISNNIGTENYVAELKEVKSKAAEEYKRAKQTGGTAWPEFEKFATDFEKVVVNER